MKAVEFTIAQTPAIVCDKKGEGFPMNQHIVPHKNPRRQTTPDCSEVGGTLLRVSRPFVVGITATLDLYQNSAYSVNHFANITKYISRPQC